MGIIDGIRPWVGLTAAAGQAPTMPIYAPTPVASPWADADQLAKATIAGLYDQTGAVLPITRTQALAVPAMVRCRDLLCVSVARMPLYAYTPAGRMPVQPRICQRPDIGRSYFQTMVWTVDTLVFYGFAVWEILKRYSDDGRPMIARYVPPSRVETDPDSGEVVTVNGRRLSSPFDVIRIDGPHEGLLNRSAEALNGSRSIYSSYVAAAGQPNPDVELHQTGGEPLTEAEIDAMVARWAAARAGRNGRVAFTNQSIEAKMHGQQPEDLLISARNAVVLDSARMLNLPAWAVDGEVGGSSLTYQNVPSRSRELIDYSLAGYMEAIAGRLSLDDVLPAGQWCEFDTDVLTDGSFGERMADYKNATDSGVYSPVDLRKREAGIPLEGQPTA